MKKVAQNVLLALPIGALAYHANAQATPAATTQPAFDGGFQLPTTGGNFSYALSASETITTEYEGSGGTAASTNLSGDAAYITVSERHPFSVIYAGGYLIGDTGNEPSVFYQNLALSQVYKTRHWEFVATDSVSYLPNSPTTGLSGVLGVGDAGDTPVGSTLNQSILTTNDPRVDNSISGSVLRDITANTSAHVTGSYEMLRFLGDSTDVIDSNDVSGSAGVTHRLDARNSIGGSYAYSSFSYADGESLTFNSQSINFEYTRNWTRRLTMTASIGPEFASSSNSALLSNSVNVGAGLSLNYAGKNASGTLSFVRGENTGSGLTAGALTDSIGLTGRRSLNRVWAASASVVYSHANNLPNQTSGTFTTNSEVASVQLSRGIGRSLSAFLSYAVERQSDQGITSTAIYNGTSQVIGFGLTYSPSVHHVGRP